MNRLETKTYRLIAHLADGDIEIKPKGKNKFSTLNEAVEARNEHLDMCDDIDIVVETLKEELIKNGWKYCYWEDAVITDEYAKELGLIDDEI